MVLGESETSSHECSLDLVGANGCIYAAVDGDAGCLGLAIGAGIAYELAHVGHAYDASRKWGANVANDGGYVEFGHWEINAVDSSRNGRDDECHVVGRHS